MQQKREIGRSGIKIAPLVLGGNVFGWTADEKASFAILDAFVDQGGDAIDTADVYSAWVPGHEGGESERVMAAWLKQSGKRNKVVIGTKVGMLPKHLGIKRQTIIDACDDSLKRLGIETIDLYWLHRDDEATSAEEYTGALDELLKAGKIRSFGASNFKPARFGEGIREARVFRFCLIMVWRAAISPASIAARPTKRKARAAAGWTSTWPARGRQCSGLWMRSRRATKRRQRKWRWHGLWRSFQRVRRLRARQALRS